MNLKDIANRDYRLDELNEVTAHEGAAARRKNMRFYALIKINTINAYGSMGGNL